MFLNTFLAQSQLPNDLGSQADSRGTPAPMMMALHFQAKKVMSPSCNLHLQCQCHGPHHWKADQAAPPYRLALERRGPSKPLLTGRAEISTCQMEILIHFHL